MLTAAFNSLAFGTTSSAAAEGAVSYTHLGYSVTRTIPGLKIVKDYRDVTPGSRVLVNLHEGSLVCSIEKADSGEEVLEGK